MAPRFCGHLWRAPNTRRSDDKSASRTGTLGGSDSTIPPSMRDEPATTVRRHLIFLDRVVDGRCSIGRVVDDADELRGHVPDEDSPGIGLADLSWLGHCGVGPTVCGVTVTDSDQIFSRSSLVMGTPVRGGQGDTKGQDKSRQVREQASNGLWPGVEGWSTNAVLKQPRMRSIPTG